VEALRDKHKDENVSILVAPSDLPFGLSRQAELLQDEPGHKIYVFRSLGAAREGMMEMDLGA